MATKSTNINNGPKLPYYKYIFQGDHWGVFMIIALIFLSISLALEGVKGGWITNLLFLAVFGILLTWSILGWKRQ